MTKGSVLKEMNQKVDSGFSQEEVLKIMRDVCEAVALMHSCIPPIIHRDLKVCLCHSLPKNINIMVKITKY